MILLASPWGPLKNRRNNKAMQITKEVKYTLGAKLSKPEEQARIFLRYASAQERNEYNLALTQGIGLNTKVNSALANVDIFDKLFKRVENLFDGEVEITAAAEIPDEYKGEIGASHMNRSEVIDVKNC